MKQKRLLFSLLFFIISILFIPSISKSSTLNSLNYKNGELILKFDSPIKKDYKTKYESSVYLLNIEFPNIKLSNNLKNKVYNISDKLLDTIVLDSLGNKTSMYIYAQDQIDFDINVKNNEMSIKIQNQQRMKRNKKTIVLDAGHGGKDTGARGNGYNEKDLALAVILKLKVLLEKEYNVILTRDDDFFVTLTDRAKIANDNHADLFVSIHLNSSKRSSSANGTEVFYFTKNPSAYAKEISKYEDNFDKSSALAIEKSQFLLDDITYHSNQIISAGLAKTVLDNLISDLDMRRRGVFGANFAVLRGTKAPAILIELGFISNIHDSSIYSNDEMQEKAAEAIYKAIKLHFN